jgi:hypothetical protein
MHQIRYRRGIEAKALLRDHGDETGARLEIRIIEFAIALILLEMGSILGREERALVMIEPPGNFRRTGILEIDDGILIAVEINLVKERARPMQEPGESEIHIPAYALAVEAGKERGGRGSIEAFVVIKNSDSQLIPQFAPDFRRIPSSLGSAFLAVE